MTDPLRDALRECEAYFEEGDDDEWYGDEERRLLVAVQAALRTPRIASDEMVRLDVILRATADEHADVLRPKQVDALYDAAAILAAMGPSND